MSAPTRWQRLIGWIIDRLASWLPEECGLLAPEGDVYCSLSEGHAGLHGWEGDS